MFLCQSCIRQTAGKCKTIQSEQLNMVNSSKWDIHVILCFGIYTMFVGSVSILLICQPVWTLTYFCVNF